MRVSLFPRRPSNSTSGRSRVKSSAWQVGTLNYMSPEAILGGATNIRGGPPMKVGRPSDVWSLGCILYQMVRLPKAANERPGSWHIVLH